MIEIKDVSYTIGEKTIVDKVSLTIPQHGITALIGANGVGKSTLLSLMARLNPLSSGSIAYQGHDLAHTHTAKIAKMVAIMTQENSIHSRISVRDLLLFGRYPHHQGQPSAHDHAIVDTALAQFQLESFAQRYLTELSGGQRQRALIAMVFCQSTEYVLLDEPLNNLDMYYARNLMQLLRHMADEHGRTIVVVLHDINQAAAYADYVVAMQQGQIKFQGSPDQVFTEENIKILFDMDVHILNHQGKKLIVHHI